MPRDGGRWAWGLPRHASALQQKQTRCSQQEALPTPGAAPALKSSRARYGPRSPRRSHARPKAVCAPAHWGLSQRRTRRARLRGTASSAARRPGACQRSVVVRRGLPTVGCPAEQRGNVAALLSGLCSRCPGRIAPGPAPRRVRALGGAVAGSRRGSTRCITALRRLFCVLAGPYRVQLDTCHVSIARRRRRAARPAKAEVLPASLQLPAARACVPVACVSVWCLAAVLTSRPDALRSQLRRGSSRSNRHGALRAR